MQELIPRFFLGVTVELNALRTHLNKVPDKNEVLLKVNADNFFIPLSERLLLYLSTVNAASAIASAKRLDAQLKMDTLPNMGELHLALTDIESRFVDHLEYVKLYAIQPQEVSFMEPAKTLLAVDGKPIEDIAGTFPTASFEIEEAAKCFAFGRYTASVFHCMRTMEIGLKVLARKLGIPNPVTPTDRNWGNMLKAIKDKIDEKWPKNTRLHGTEGERMEALYNTLDSVKNPWRNATMHVEVTYAPHEALHIMRCVGIYVLELKKHANESILVD